ncbi:LuxR C-terminal-related transcriptional regulator [Acinetobacter sp. WCHAc060025]|uniref:LuxR C-terminal-related transcriptional regulator n=1 Tax=Acinetobacter sp. WCHAc060025 TaxID=2518625 RepID=UPI0010230CB1|nr:response regulator transcription factor [Acinetobacter sp. WCHAc060025]RZG75765.1 response regulator transcription factor [Acinetobacter sp. WCHAc060025]
MFSVDTELIKPVLVLEDDPVVQDRMYSILVQFGYVKEDITFVQTIKGAIEQYSILVAKLVLVDLGLPDGNGIDFISYIREDLQDSEIPIMVVSAWNSAEVILKALSAGATGYVLKERDDFELIFAIRSLLRGGVIIDPFIANQILKNVHAEDVVKPEAQSCQLETNLSARELEILNLVAVGNSSREISEQLNISKFTVDCHIKNIYHKLSVNSRTKAINMAKTIGLIS